MVEKIIVNPESIRGLGNILSAKADSDFDLYNSVLSESEDTVYGATKSVFVLEYQATSYTVALTVSSSTVNIGSSITLTATVTDEEEEPVEGVSVSFKVGSSIIGSDETDSSGEASYSYTCNSAGTLSITAICAGSSSSASTVTVNKLNTSTSLSSTGVNVLVGTSITLTATVTSSSTPVEGLTITFKDGNTTLGTGTTNSSGQATYTTSSLSVATHSMTAVTSENDTYNTSTSSAVSVVVYDHSYSLAFSSSTYTATSGSATLSVTLTDNNVAVSGATVTVTGSDSSLYSGITNSSGVASVTVSGVSSETTFTATYGNVSDTCTVIVSSYIFVDDASVDNSSNYTSYGIQNTSGAVNIAWDSGESAYKITNSTSSGRALIQFGNTILQNNLKMSADIKLGGTSYKENGMLAFIDKDSQTTYSLAGWVQGQKYCRLTEFNGTSELQTTANSTWSSLDTSGYNHHELLIHDGVVTYTITTPSNATKTLTLTLQQSNYIGGKLGLFVEVFGSATHCYIKNIKVEPLSQLFSDACTSDRSSEYTNASIQTSSRTGYLPLTYNSNGYYTIQATTNEGNHYAKWITSVTGQDNVKFSCEVSTNAFSDTNRFGIIVGSADYKSERYHISNKKLEHIKQNGTTESVLDSPTLSLTANAWYKMEYIVQGTSYTFTISDSNNNSLYTTTGTFASDVITSSTTKQYGLYYLNYNSSTSKNYRNIKVEPL